MPKYENSGAFTVQNEKIYAVGWVTIKRKEWSWRVRVFDGKKWTLL